MVQFTINGGDTGLNIRNGLNGMFGEIYSGLLPAAPVNPSPYVRMNGGWSRTFIARPYDSGSWYQPDIGLNYAAGAAIPINAFRYLPMVFYRDVTVAELGVRITTAIAGSKFQLAIYAAGASGIPDGPPLVTTADFVVATATTMSSPVVTPALIPAGIYWAAIIADTAGNVFLTVPAAVGFAPSYFGATDVSGVTSTAAINTYVYAMAGTYGTWPTLSGGPVRSWGTTTVQTAAMFWRAQ